MGHFPGWSAGDAPFLLFGYPFQRKAGPRRTPGNRKIWEADDPVRIERAAGDIRGNVIIVALQIVYNFNMLTTPEVVFWLLFSGVTGMAVLAAFFLRGRSLSVIEAFGWGALIIFFAVPGTFLTILVRPGTSKKQQKSAA